MTITIGAWGIPLTITIIAFGWAFWMQFKEPSTGFGDGITLVFCGGVASFISLIAWIIYVICDKIWGG